MKNIPRTGKRHLPKTAFKGKRYRCATCHKRSPRPVKTSAHAAALAPRGATELRPLVHRDYDTLDACRMLACDEVDG